MSTITSLVGTDGITTANSMTKINTNFSNLNTDKIETSVIDTDTTLAANSDSKIPSQKAVKAYVDSGGNPNASTTQRGIVEEATAAEVLAGTATGGTGARLFVNPSTLPLANYKNGVVSYDTSTASGTQNIAHGLSSAPVKVKLSAFTPYGTTTNQLNGSIGSYDSGGNSCIYFTQDVGSYPKVSSSSTKAIFLQGEVGTVYTAASVTVDATNIILTWGKVSGMSGTAYIHWEANT